MSLIRHPGVEDIAEKIKRVLKEKDERNAELTRKLAVAERSVGKRRERLSVKIPPVSRRGRPLARPQETYLFCHPSWWNWWLKKNFEENPENMPVTGIFMVYVEDYEEDGWEHQEKVKGEVEALGLDYVLGVRHSHTKPSEKKNPLSSKWQEKRVKQLTKTKEGSLLLDMEPYYKGSNRYHGAEDWGKLAKACEPWVELGRGGEAQNLYVYPAYPSFSHPMALMSAASRGICVGVMALDHTTYRGPDKFKGDYKKLTTYMSEQDALWLGQRQRYSPGFYLHWLKDKECMRRAAGYRTTWFFPRTAGHPDDLPNFGKPSWRPGKVR